MKNSSLWISKTTRGVAMIFGVLLIPLCAYAASFSDVPDSHPNFTAIQSLKDAGVINGYPDGTFKPDTPINRAEALAIILKSAGITAEKTTTKLPFTDVPETAWFYPMVQKGFAMGKIKGYSDNTFRPEAQVTLPEALAMGTAFFGINVKDVVIDTVIYPGLDTAAWYAPYAQYAKNLNLIEPDVRGFVSATNAMTRAALAELMYRMRKVKETGNAFDITSKWQVEEYADNFWRLKRPASWQLAFKGSANTVLVKPGARSSLFFTRLFPDSARLSISVVDNPEELSATSYFAKLKSDYVAEYEGQNPLFENRTLSGKNALWIAIPESHVFDSAIYLPNKQLLMIYGEYGSAPIGEYLKKQMQTMVGSYEYLEKPAPPPQTLEDRVAKLRENILVKDAWKTIDPLFPDKKLISTDAIGIGTGPVDYYFTAEANLTIKLERDSGTILNTREGSTSAF